MTKHTPLRPRLRSVDGGRPLRDVALPPGYRPPLQAPAWRDPSERARLDKEYALLRHNERRKLLRITLLPHACLTFIVWSIPDGPFLLQLLLTTSFVAHALIARTNRRPIA